MGDGPPGGQALIATACASSCAAVGPSQTGFMPAGEHRWFIHRNATPPRRNLIMTTFNINAAALVLSLAMTFGVFSSVTSLSAPSHAGALLVQADQAPRS
jgi:hypothetical protein